MNNGSQVHTDRKRRYSYHTLSQQRHWFGAPAKPALDMSEPTLAPNSTRVLVACMPKSASTFLTAAIAALPGMRRTSLYPGPVRRREQEFDLLRLLQEESITAQLRKAHFRGTLTSNLSRLLRGKGLDIRSRRAEGWVAQQHTRYSTITSCIIEDYEIVPVFLVRNIFDALISMRDHLRNNAVYMAMAYFSPDMRSWSDEQMADYLIDLVAPWYISFYVSWQECPERIEINFEQVRSDPEKCLRDIFAATQLSYSDDEIAAAIAKAKTKKVRMNKGISGRGTAFDDTHRERIRRYASYYPDVDFTPIGITK